MVDARDQDPPLPPATFVAAQLRDFFGPLTERFIGWRQRTVPQRSPVDVAGLVSPATEAGPRDIDLLGNGAAHLRPWPYFLHTFSRDAAWDIPVGAYGATWAHQLGAIAEALRHDWDVFADTDDQCRMMLSAADRTLVLHATFWGATYASREPAWWETAPGQTMREGITSVAQGLALLTLDAVDGYTNAAQLAHDAVAAGLLDDLALQMPLNTIQPMIAGRFAAPGPVLVRSPSGEIQFGPEMAAFMSEQSGLYRQKTAARSDAERIADGAASAGQGCPVAGVHNGRISAVTGIAQLFEWLIVQLSKPPSRPTV